VGAAAVNKLEDAVIPVDDIRLARLFYLDLLGGTECEHTAGAFFFSLLRQHVRCNFSPSGSGSVKSDLSDKASRTSVRPAVRLRVDRDSWPALVSHLLSVRGKLPNAPSLTYGGSRFEDKVLSIVDPFGNGIEFVADRDALPRSSRTLLTKLLLLILFAAVGGGLLHEVVNDGGERLAARYLPSQFAQCLNARACIP
jgi:extradiol dioxygenase family protein